MSDITTPDVQVFRIYIEASAQQVWDAITSPEFSVKYGYGGTVEYDLTPGGDYRSLTTEEMRQMGMGDVAVTGRVIEADPPRKLVQTWIAGHNARRMHPSGAFHGFTTMKHPCFA